MKKNLITALVPAAAIALVLASCGIDAPKKPTEPTSLPASTMIDLTNRTATEVPMPKPKPKAKPAPKKSAVKPRAAKPAPVAPVPVEPAAPVRRCLFGEAFCSDAVR